MLVSAQDSPEELQGINNRLAQIIPTAELVLVPGGHPINPAHPLVLDFLDQHL